MDDVALANYIAGAYFGLVEAGRLDDFCSKLLGVRAGIEIWFSDYTLVKLRERHGDINFFHYRYMPSILLHGCVAKGRKSTLLELWWVGHCDPETMAFQVVLKATSKGEVYIETFHRVHLKDACRVRRKALREGRLVRDQSFAEVYIDA